MRIKFMIDICEDSDFRTILKYSEELLLEYEGF